MRRRYECLAIIAASCLLLQGCSNAIVYGEQESIGVAIKTQPDPQAPITGTIGVRQHIIAVVPPITQESSPPDAAEVAELKALLSAVETGLTQMQTIHQGPHGGGSAAGGQAAKQEVVFVPRKGEAVSLISSFKFVKIPGRIEIRTALITGQAAAHLNLREAGAAAAAIAGGTPSAAVRIAVFRLVINDLRQMAGNSPPDQTAIMHVSRMNVLVREIPRNYPLDLWISDGTNLTVDGPKGAPVSINQTGLDLALTYWGKVKISFDFLNEAIEDSTMTIKGFPQSPELKVELINMRKETLSELGRIGGAVGSDAAMLDAIRYWMNLQE